MSSSKTVEILNADLISNSSFETAAFIQTDEIEASKIALVNNANIIYGSVTKTKLKPPFQCFDKPNYLYSKHQRINAHI